MIAKANKLAKKGKHFQIETIQFDFFQRFPIIQPTDWKFIVYGF
jgi:hypothetical protein